MFQGDLPAACIWSSRGIQVSSVYCLTHPLSAGPPQTGCGLQTSLVVRTVVYPQPPVCFVPLSVLQLCLLCLALPERRLWASTTYTSHLIWPNMSSVPGLFYPLCHTATWPHNTGKGPNCGHTGQDRQAQSLPVPHADALGLYSEATSPQLMYGLNSTPTGRQPFC